MIRHLHVLLAAALVVLAGCAGAFTTPTADAPTTSAEGVTNGEPAPIPTDSVRVEVEPSRPVSTDALAAFDASSPHATLGQSGTITVSATGRATADPNLALVFVTVEASADTADAARERVADDVSRMRAAVRDLGIPDDAVRTTHFHLAPRYDYGRDRQELVGYVATHGFRIESGVERAGEVVDVAVGNGADQVTGVQFTLTDEVRSELRAQALRDAVGNARADADAIAAAADLSIASVHSASTTGSVAIPYAERLAVAGDGRTTFDAGPVTVTAAVTVSYAIE